jgi:threonylcarbamoyladenosine tRNA methylthiotransferase MtaB
MQKVKFYTLGCKVNQYETQAIREQFINAGFREMDNGNRVDVCVINTCTVTHRADADSLNYIRRARRENPSAKLIVTGCLTELDEERIRFADSRSLIVRNKYKSDMLRYFFSRYPQTRKPANPQTILGISNFAGHTRAFLKIQDGCDNFCSYCKVPLVRGRSRSKPEKEIIAEARDLVRNGFKEIVLCGICLGAYGKGFEPQGNLVEVIRTLEKIDGLLRIRLSSIEAGDVSEALIDKIAESKKLCRHLHIPLQSGSDQMLKIMNRNYTRADYLELIHKIKKKLPQVAITTDVLVGFPGESENDFQDTLELIRDILPLKVHIFPYSPRTGTAAYGLKDLIETTAVKDRVMRLKKLACRCASIYSRQFLGKITDVLIEGKMKNSPYLWWGYTNNYIKVFIKSTRNLHNVCISFKLKKIDKNGAF